MSVTVVQSGSAEGSLQPISHGIHSLVQPLTAAQCLLEFTLHKGGTAEEYRAAIEKALAELRRISDSVSFVRELIHIEQDGTDVITFPLKPAVRNVLTELQPVMDEAGIHVLVNETDGEPTVRMSPMRLRQALFYQLQAMQLSCSSGESLQVDVKATSESVELCIERLSRNARVVRDSEPGVSDRITQALYLAKAIINKAGGKLDVSESPLRAVIRFCCEAEVDRLNCGKVQGPSFQAES
jgi:C4-dicarboxylate-specific signal transduction histidine kinase